MDVTVKLNLEEISEEMLREKTFIFYKRKQRPNFWVSNETTSLFLKDHFKTLSFEKVAIKKDQKSNLNISIIVNKEFIHYLKLKLNTI